MPVTLPSMTPLAPMWRSIMGSGRLLLAVTCVASLVARFVWGLRSVTFDHANFFAYLTIQSNIAFALVTSIAGIAMIGGRRIGPLFDALRAGVVTCTTTAGIVFGVILQQSTIRGVKIDVPWSDVVLHFVLPVLALVDWALTPHSRPRLRLLVFVLGYVGTWGAITMIRGDITGWYPYYFLDPSQSDGPAEFALFSGIAVAIFVAVGLVVIALRPNSAVSPLARREEGPAEPPT